MRQFTSTVLLLFIGQVAVGQEAVDEGTEGQVVTSSEVYNVQLFATSAEVDATALIGFESSDEPVCMAMGGFEFIESRASYVGSWYGFSWGPLTFRFGGAASEGDDNLMLSSLAFGEVLIGRGLTFGSNGHERFFVFGTMTDDSPTPGEDDPTEVVDGEEPADDVLADEPTDEEATLDDRAS